MCIRDREAEDVVQQAFLQAYRSLAGFDPHLTFSAWMYRIVHNTAVNMARKRHGTVPTELQLDGEMVEILTGDTGHPYRRSGSRPFHRPAAARWAQCRGACVPCSPPCCG